MDESGVCLIKPIWCNLKIESGKLGEMTINSKRLILDYSKTTAILIISKPLVDYSR